MNKEKKLSIYCISTFVLILAMLSFVYADGEIISCYSNSDCINGFFGQEYCNGNDVFKNFQNSSCINSGMSDSYCNNIVVPTFLFNCGNDSWGDYGENYCKLNDVYHSRAGILNGCRLINIEGNISGCYSEFGFEETLVSECPNGCLDGSCIEPVIVCYNDNECSDDDLYTYDKCENPGTGESYCSHTAIKCINNNDCGMTGFFGDEFCSGNDVFKNFLDSNCINPGTIESYCQNSTTPTQIVDCGDSYCENGDNYCKLNDVYYLKECYNKGCNSGGCYTSLNSEEVLVESCSNGCSNGACIGGNIACYNDSQCGTNGFIDGLFCENNSVFQNYIIYTCNNPGTTTSSCTSSTNSQLKITCSSSETCLNGQCSSVACNNDNDCDDNDTNTEDKCVNPGAISSSCIYTPIICINNFQCGTNGFMGQNFCQDKDVFDNYITYTCNNPGTINSSCSQTSSPSFVQNCSYDCLNGTCVNLQPQCLLNSDCGISSSKLVCEDYNVINRTILPVCINQVCQNQTITSIVEECSYKCSSAKCIDRPNNNNDGIDYGSPQTSYSSGGMVNYSLLDLNSSTQRIGTSEVQIKTSFNTNLFFVLLILIILLIVLIIMLSLMR